MPSEDVFVTTNDCCDSITCASGVSFVADPLQQILEKIDKLEKERAQDRLDISRLKKTAMLHGAWEVVTSLVFVRNCTMQLVKGGPKPPMTPGLSLSAARQKHWRAAEIDRWNKLQDELDWLADAESLRLLDNAVRIRNELAHPQMDRLFIEKVRDHLSNPDILEHLRNQGVEIQKLGKDLVLLERPCPPGLLTLTGF